MPVLLIIRGIYLSAPEMLNPYPKNPTEVNSIISLFILGRVVLKYTLNLAVYVPNFLNNRANRAGKIIDTRGTTTIILLPVKY